VEDRVLTLPNSITVVRLCLLPLFIWVLLGRHDRVAAGWVLGVMGATDWVDGYTARHLHQVSTVGKVLDPVADRLLLLGGIAAILADGSAPVWFAVVALVREGSVAVATLALRALGAKRIDVTWFGKAGTFGLMCAFPLFVWGHAHTSWHRPCEVLAWVTGIVGLVLGLYALVLYVPLARQALADGRRDRAVDNVDAVELAP
jgi:cardiolipin synthase (CMP-forming)